MSAGKEPVVKYARQFAKKGSLTEPYGPWPRNRAGGRWRRSVEARDPCGDVEVRSDCFGGLVGVCCRTAEEGGRGHLRRCAGGPP